jgi:large subunit ribosomal protein L30
MAEKKTVRITQTGSPIGRQPGQRETLKDLGLNKMNRSKVVEDTHSIRGMVDKVAHMLNIEPAN